MANQEHLDILNQGVKAWNEWRTSNPEVTPDLTGANLFRANLDEALLTKANLSHAYLIEARLGEAYLSRATLDGAKLCRAIWTGRISTGQI